MHIVITTRGGLVEGVAVSNEAHFTPDRYSVVDFDEADQFGLVRGDGVSTDIEGAEIVNPHSAKWAELSLPPNYRWVGIGDAR